MNRLIFIIGVVCLLTTGAIAQLETVRLRVDSTGIGVGGYYQPGSWTAMLLTLENPSPQPRKVICEWSVPDADGDTVQHRRWVTLGPGPGNVQQAWLYAMLPVGISPQASAQVRVMEAGTDETLTTTQARVLAQVTVPLPKRLAMEQRPIGIVGSSAGMMGLRPYETLPTQHEALLLIGGLEPSQLPDRWYGLAMLQTLIWTPSAGDPGAMEVSEVSRQALREWVKRGGHLVVILPSEGDAWPRSPLRDILPIESDQIRKIEEIDRYEFSMSQAGPVTIALTARQIGSPLHGMLKVVDSAGRVLV
ncbi:MAG: hypothetical protein HC898_07270, partial [Phycisphaerales bacterium]|nr:hypothetical protein [Phycisphaerales bacterium]